MANLNNREKTFKISQLEEIQNLDDKDLFLVSDYENGQCYTKKLTLHKLMQTIVNNPSLVQTILESSDQIDVQIVQKIDQKIEQSFSNLLLDGGNSIE